MSDDNKAAGSGLHDATCSDSLRLCIERVANRTWRCGRPFTSADSAEIEEALRVAYYTQRPEARFEVMLHTGGYVWEESLGPYPTYEAAEKARLGWFRQDEIPDMRVVQFYSPNADVDAPPSEGGSPEADKPTN